MLAQGSDADAAAHTLKGGSLQETRLLFVSCWRQIDEAVVAEAEWLALIGQIGNGPARLRTCPQLVQLGQHAQRTLTLRQQLPLCTVGNGHTVGEG